MPPMPQSNNPFRASMLPSPDHPVEPRATTPSPELPPTPPTPLYKTPSTSTTIAEELRFSQDIDQADLANTQTATVSVTSLPMETLPKNKDVVITIHGSLSEASMPSEPPPCHKSPRQSGAGSRGEGMRPSMQMEECGMWPARRMLQKQAADKKRLWMWLKIVIAILILGAAVAVGMGISKAVNAKH
ncbi:hypothetical protein BDD12DRAFT_434714 [Trichophaea hybrida]|nr:hypothetical protein BDD12DRAFT_434714 [Trichophaea hybrida]